MRHLAEKGVRVHETVVGDAEPDGEDDDEPDNGSNGESDDESNDGDDTIPESDGGDTSTID